MKVPGKFEFLILGRRGALRYAYASTIDTEHGPLSFRASGTSMRVHKPGGVDLAGWPLNVEGLTNRAARIAVAHQALAMQAQLIRNKLW